MRSRVFGYFLGGVPAGQKPVSGVEGGVQQVLTVKFLEEHRIEQLRGGLRIARVRRVNALEALDGAGVVQVIEVLKGLAHQRVAVEGIGMHLCSPT